MSWMRRLLRGSNHETVARSWRGKIVFLRDGTRIKESSVETEAAQQSGQGDPCPT
ncbi:putative RING zinc finger domain superfamily protein [Iris pallida]|uniref:RING zinc finger domain superfamily protein n=1 Tax=Iris pallida TaxID=29817 RepID=A0AAX6EMT6_IRIPA|nr:putative RING zinc finger domain superfamily protein [Iris pallida]